MAVGSKTYEGLAVPLLGESRIVGQTAADDILTIQGASGQTGKHLVIRNASQTELFSIDSAGGLSATTSLAAASEVITQTAAGTVGLKILRASTPTASAIQVTDNGGTAQWSVTKNYGVLWKVRTTRPTTGLTKGEMMVLFHGSTPKIGIVSSTAANTIKLIRLKTKTFGRLTA